MKALYRNPIAIILIILAIGSFIYFEEQLPAIDLSHLTPGNVMAMLGYISVIMLVVEQFIEIFVDDPNQKVKIQCKDRITDINKFLERLNNPIDVAALTDPESTEEKPESAEVAKMMKEKKELEEFLMTRGLKRQRRTTIIAFAIGLILSFSGLRLMAGIVFNGPETELSSIQITIIQSIDIVLTAGIIAGGSGRVHRLMKRIKETMGGGSSINSL
ncbi:MULTISPECIES: hypothetical protein [Aquimarina]|uniref:Uncharacterized protein n=1 Tax=Aquimarina algiphila TaxID=2047982 RepID=A0A554VKY5_9FLAO|nr:MULTISPECIES: hypothetical protein [Aquimarina]TSE08746.1 hypothetical protein FOF46_11415 [Aquimarina algiphila]